MALDFSLTAEQEQVMEAVRKFAEKEISPGVIERDINGEFHWEGWKKAAEFGLQGMPFPQEYGGQGYDVITTMAAMVGLGKGSKDEGFNLSLGAHLVISTIPIWQWGTEEQKKKYLPKLASGEWIGAFGLTEPNAGSDAFALKTKAVPTDDGKYYILNGTKMFITNGPIANVVLVAARVGEGKGAQGLTVFIVETGYPDWVEGFSVAQKLDKIGMRTSPTGELVFEDLKVPAENILGGVGNGAMVLVDTLTWERSLLIAPAIGSMELGLERAIKYSLEREQFGKPIAKFQAIQHKIAMMKVHLEAARWLVYKSAWLREQGIQSVLDASIAKLFLSDVGMKMALDEVQIHGGYGLIREYEVERGLRDALLASIGGGTSEIQKSIIARTLLGV